MPQVIKAWFLIEVCAQHALQVQPLGRQCFGACQEVALCGVLGPGAVAAAAAAAAAKSLQLCPTLCDPIDGLPPGSPIPGILQARTLEWVAISFSNSLAYLMLFADL